MITTGIGFPSLLALIFIALKLCHVIGWDWIWILAPLWLSFVSILIFASITAIIVLWWK